MDYTKLKLHGCKNMFLSKNAQISKILQTKYCWTKLVFDMSTNHQQKIPNRQKFSLFWINIYLFYCYSVLFLAKMVCNNISTHFLLFCIRIPTKHCTLMVFINYRSRTFSIFYNNFSPKYFSFFLKVLYYKIA